MIKKTDQTHKTNLCYSSCCEIQHCKSILKTLFPLTSTDIRPVIFQCCLLRFVNILHVVLCCTGLVVSSAKFWKNVHTRRHRLQTMESWHLLRFSMKGQQEGKVNNTNMGLFNLLLSSFRKDLLKQGDLIPSNLNVWLFLTKTWPKNDEIDHISSSRFCAYFKIRYWGQWYFITKHILHHTCWTAAVHFHLASCNEMQRKHVNYRPEQILLFAFWENSDPCRVTLTHILH